MVSINWDPDQTLHTETEPRFKVLFQRLKKPRIEPMTQGQIQDF